MEESRDEKVFEMEVPPIDPYATVRDGVERRIGHVRRLARAGVIFAALAVLAAGQGYAEAHGGSYPLGASIAELMLAALLILVFGNYLVGIAFARIARRKEDALGAPAPDPQTASYEELEAFKRRAEDGRPAGYFYSLLLIWLLLAFSSCGRMGLAPESAGVQTSSGSNQFVLLFAVFVIGAAVVGFAFVLWGVKLVAAQAVAKGWTNALDHRYWELYQQQWEMWKTAHPEDVERIQKAEEAERRKEEEQRQEMERQSEIRAAHQKNPALCPRCGSADVILLGDDFKPSVLGALIGSSEGLFGAAAGAALLSKRRRELMCRDCGARWMLK